VVVVVNPPSGSRKNRDHGNNGNNAACGNKRVSNGMPVDQIAATGL